MQDALALAVAAQAAELLQQQTSHGEQLECMQVQHSLSLSDLDTKLQAANAALSAQPCSGLRSDRILPLVGIGLGQFFGNLSAEYFFHAASLQAKSCGSTLPVTSFFDFERMYPAACAAVQESFHQLPLYRSCSDCLRSLMCLKCSPTGSCAMCLALGKERSITMRLHRTSNGGVALQPSKYTRHDRVSVACLIQRLNSKSSMLTELFFDVSNTKSSLAVAEKRIQKLESKMESGLRHDNAPKFLKHFIQALQMGILPPQAMQDIMEDMGASLMMHKAKRNQTSRSLYITLLNNGSPWICSLVSKALGGPHIRTIKSWRGTDSFHFKPGLRVENMQQLVQILNAFGLLDVPGIWSEDATTCLKRLAVSLDYEPGEVYIEGFINPVRVRCIDDFKKACADYGPSGLATYVYVWTWIPLIPHAPYFPVFWIASNNRFNAAQVWSWWMWLFQEGQKAGIKCTGDVSDGDARLRRTQYEANKHNKLQTATRTINHPLIFMHISYIFEQPMLMHQDWMHLSGFRIRRLLLDGVHNFHLGDGANAGGEYLRKLFGTHLSAKDVDHKEK